MTRVFVGIIGHLHRRAHARFAAQASQQGSQQQIADDLELRRKSAMGRSGAAQNE
jgi:hypothetical protein